MSDAIEIRMLRPGDAQILDRVAPDTFDGPIDPHWTAEFLACPRHHMAVAIEEGVVVGMASAIHYVHPDKAPALWINEVGVAPACQRRGIGKRLVREILAHSKRIGCTEAWLGTEPENTAARALYRSTRGEEQQMIYVTFDLDDID